MAASFSTAYLPFPINTASIKTSLSSLPYSHRDHRKLCKTGRSPFWAPVAGRLSEFVFFSSAPLEDNAASAMMKRRICRAGIRNNVFIRNEGETKYLIAYLMLIGKFQTGLEYVGITALLCIGASTIVSSSPLPRSIAGFSAVSAAPEASGAVRKTGAHASSVSFAASCRKAMPVSQFGSRRPRNPAAFALRPARMPHAARWKRALPFSCVRSCK